MSEDENPYRDFRWEVPEHFNFGTAIDAFGAEPGRPAILCEDQDGNRARLCFADIREQSNRIANVLAGLGVKPGDPVIIALPRITLWQAAYVGALKAGAIVIPCDATLRDKDLIYRANHSGAVAIIAAVESADLISDLRSQCPALKHYLIAGSPRSGWLGMRASMAMASARFSPVRTRASDPAICFYTLPPPRTNPRPCCTAMPTPGAIGTPGATGSTSGRANCTGPPRIRDGRRRGTECCSDRG